MDNTIHGLLMFESSLLSQTKSIFMWSDGATCKSPSNWTCPLDSLSMGEWWRFLDSHLIFQSSPAVIFIWFCLIVLVLGSQVVQQHERLRQNPPLHQWGSQDPCLLKALLFCSEVIHASVHYPSPTLCKSNKVIASQEWIVMESYFGLSLEPSQEALGIVYISQKEGILGTV